MIPQLPIILSGTWKAEVFRSLSHATCASTCLLLAGGGSAQRRRLVQVLSRLQKVLVPTEESQVDPRCGWLPFGLFRCAHTVQHQHVVYPELEFISSSKSGILQWGQAFDLVVNLLLGAPECHTGVHALWSQVSSPF